MNEVDEAVYTFVRPPSPALPADLKYFDVLLPDTDAAESSLRLYVLILKSLFCDNVRIPFMVVLSRRETGADPTAPDELLSSRFLNIPLPSIVCEVVVLLRTILPVPR